MDRIEIASSRGFYAAMLVLALGFVAGFGFLLLRFGLRSEAAWVAVPGVLFFGAGVVLFARQIVDRRPRLVVDERGVTDRTLGVGLIPWREIIGAHLQSIQGNAFICLKVRNPAAWLRKMSPFQRMLVKGNRALGFSELNLNLSGVAMRPEQVLELVVQRVAAERERYG